MFAKLNGSVCTVFLKKSTPRVLSGAQGREKITDVTRAPLSTLGVDFFKKTVQTEPFSFANMLQNCVWKILSGKYQCALWCTGTAEALQEFTDDNDGASN